MKQILGLLFSITTLATPIWAQDGAQTLSLSPAVVMLRGELGQSATQTLTLSNATELPFEFALVAEDVVVRDGKRVFVPAGELAGSIAATAVFSSKRVTIPAGKHASIEVTVTLPPNATSRAVVVLFRGVNEVMSGNTPMTASLGTLLTFKISDDTQLTVQPAVVRPQTSTVNVGVVQRGTNEGAEPLVAKAVMAVIDAQGKLVGTSAIEPRRLLPGEVSEFHGEYDGELPPGRYRLLLTYDYEGKSLTETVELTVP
ncbi:MAG TPA: hypothetical protein VEK79_02250 [Thermoanaerobaculia bacterium]|nr:hypothetical protein [Thermoanaerobaculia bacterium]